MDRDSEYYVALAWDPSTGKVDVESSSTFENCRDDILQEAIPKLLHYVQILVKKNPIRQVENCFHGELRPEIDTRARQGKTLPCETRNIRKRAADDSRNSMEMLTSSKRIAQVNGLRMPLKGLEFVTHRADAAEEWTAWFSDAFRAMKQLSCCMIAKQWIKAIHPRKQSTHPYTVKSPEGEVFETTKPPYWPTQVLHREPDHLLKKDRIRLLVHLLTSTPHHKISSKSQLVSENWIAASQLKESLDCSKYESQNEDLLENYSILEHIINVRTTLEQHESGDFAPCTTITAPDFSRAPQRKIKVASPDESIRGLKFVTEYQDSETYVHSKTASLQEGTITASDVSGTCLTRRLSNLSPDGTRISNGEELRLPRRVKTSNWPICTGEQVLTNPAVPALFAQYPNSEVQPQLLSSSSTNAITAALNSGNLPLTTSHNNSTSIPWHESSTGLPIQGECEFGLEHWPSLVSTVGHALPQANIPDSHPCLHDTMLMTMSQKLQMQQNQSSQSTMNSLAADIAYPLWPGVNQIPSVLPQRTAAGFPNESQQDSALADAMSYEGANLHPPRVLSSNIHLIEQDYVNYCRRFTVR